MEPIVTNTFWFYLVTVDLWNTHTTYSRAKRVGTAERLQRRGGSCLQDQILHYRTETERFDHRKNMTLGGKGQMTFDTPCHTNCQLLACLNIERSLCLIRAAGKNSQTAHWGHPAPPIRGTTVKTQLNNGQNKTLGAAVRRRSSLIIESFILATPEHATSPPSKGRGHVTGERQTHERQWQALLRGSGMKMSDRDVFSSL